MTVSNALVRGYCLVLLFCGSVTPTFSDNLNNADLIFSYSRASSLQPRTIDTPDIRLYSDLTAIVYRPEGYKDPGEHRFQLSTETFTHLMQMLWETESDSVGINTQQANTNQSVDQNLQNIVIRSDPSITTIELTDAATEFLQAFNQSINPASLELEAFDPHTASLSTDQQLENLTTTVSVSSALQQQLLQLYKDLADVPSNDEVR